MWASLLLKESFGQEMKKEKFKFSGYENESTP
jgi:hypothetical protein